MQICYIEYHLDFSGKYSATEQLMSSDYVYANIQHCVYADNQSYCSVNGSNME